MKTNAKRAERFLAHAEFADAPITDAPITDAPGANSEDLPFQRKVSPNCETDCPSSADCEPGAFSSTRIVRALQTFFFEVSAGRHGGAGELPQCAAPRHGLPSRNLHEGSREQITETATRNDRPNEAIPPHHVSQTPDRDAALQVRSETNQVESLLLEKSPQGRPVPPDADRLTPQRPLVVTPARGAASKKIASHTPSKAPRAVQNAKKPPAKQVRRVRKLPSWLASALAHLGLIALLSTIRFAAPGLAPNLSLTSFTADLEEFETFAEMETPSFEALEDPTASSDDSLGALSQSTERPIVGDPSADAAVEGEGAAATRNDFGTLFDGDGGLNDAPDALGGEATAKFFGTSISGRRILFLLDNSGSMQGGRLETVLTELEKSVASLTPQQKFYVIFFSDDVYPLFYPQAANDYVAANETVMATLKQWLQRVELCYGDVIDEALQAADSIQPDMVFLLSDGKIASPRDLQALLTPGKPYPIHTLGVGLGNAVAARENLQRIAAANGGEFREAVVPLEIREQAQREPRPYHRNVPGDIWGRRVAPK